MGKPALSVVTICISAYVWLTISKGETLPQKFIKLGVISNRLKTLMLFTQLHPS